MKMPGGTPKPLGRVIWSLPSGTPLTSPTAPPIETLLKPGTVTLLNYYHDDDCPQLSGGACRCHGAPRGHPGGSRVTPLLEFLLSKAYAGGAVAPAHRADLEKSGITEASQIAQGIRSVPPCDFDRLLGFPVPSAVTSLMLIPYPDPAGGYFDMFQVKLFPALEDGDGHTVKYLQPRGSAPRLYFVRRVLPAVLDPRATLYAIEGAKKAIAAAQLGLAAIGFNGIQGWHGRGSLALLPDFARLPLAGRAVKVIPDGDVQTNPAVERGAGRLAEALEARGASVRVVLLPAVVAA